jgi:hypothetical protein
VPVDVERMKIPLGAPRIGEVLLSNQHERPLRHRAAIDRSLREDDLVE